MNGRNILAPVVWFWRLCGRSDEEKRTAFRLIFLHETVWTCVLPLSCGGCGGIRAVTVGKESPAGLRLREECAIMGESNPNDQEASSCPKQSLQNNISQKASSW